MKISIITVTRNSKTTLNDTILSVLNQTYKNIEYIIIDGASEDGTQELIRSYGDRINHFVSEPDTGMYDAMNKGIKLATGDIVGILNSDDFYSSNDVLEKVVHAFRNQDIQSIFADLVYIRGKASDRIVRYYDSSHFNPDKFAYGWMPAHPTFFVKRYLYELYGYFKTDYKIAADFELTARLLNKHRITYAYLPFVMVKMRLGGISTSFKSIYINSSEQLRACKENGIKTNMFAILFKYPQKLLGFLIKKNYSINTLIVRLKGIMWNF